MPVILRKNWWSLVIRGLAALCLSAITLVRPGIAIGPLAQLFFAYALIDRLVGIAGAVRAAEAHERWTSLLAEGLAGLAAAIVSAAWPVTFIGLAYVIAAWAIVTAVLEMISARRLRRDIAGEWLLASSAFASLILGALMIALPLAGAATGGVLARSVFSYLRCASGRARLSPPAPQRTRSARIDLSLLSRFNAQPIAPGRE
ncbi:MAG: hypothetical protein QOJ99_2782 [Bryobacterales bacterium]|jgi:uncharacterized membrane protein HdeD (DUF308 family)|nr:hypothetical protein [Bryobacterales bacterium]